jgi:hypothetical protein
LGACAGTSPSAVVETRELPQSSGAPRIERVVDVGGQDVPLEGVLDATASDGVAVIGEALWIRGAGFGRQPTVKVGGRPAPVLARTADGGIVTRVPAGSPSGDVDVDVDTRAGHGRGALRVRRLALALTPGAGSVAWSDVSAPASRSEGHVAVEGKVAVPGARRLALSHDGRAGYVAGRSADRMTVLELPAPGGPRVGFQLQLGGGDVVAVAAGASRLLVVTADRIDAFDTHSPLRPARMRPFTLDAEVTRAGPFAAALSPDGRTLAVALRRRNQVVLLDVSSSRGGPARVVTTVDVEPDTLVEVLVDLQFTPAGDLLWVLTGRTPDNRAAGPRPARLHAYKVNAAMVEHARTVEIPAALEPTRLGLSRSAPLPSGAAVRLPPEKATVYVSALVGDAGGSALFAVGSEDAGHALFQTVDKLGAVGVEPGGRVVMAAYQLGAGGLGVASLDASGRGGPARTRVVDAGGAFSAEGPAVLEVQP